MIYPPTLTGSLADPSLLEDIVKKINGIISVSEPVQSGTSFSVDVVAAFEDFKLIQKRNMNAIASLYLNHGWTSVDWGASLIREDASDLDSMYIVRKCLLICDITKSSVYQK